LGNTQALLAQFFLWLLTLVFPPKLGHADLS